MKNPKESTLTRKWASIISQKVRNEMENKNLSRYDLACILEVSRTRINKILSGKSNFTLNTIAKLSEVLEINLISVIPNTNEKNHKNAFDGGTDSENS